MSAFNHRLSFLNRMHQVTGWCLGKAVLLSMLVVSSAAFAARDDTPVESAAEQPVAVVVGEADVSQPARSTRWEKPFHGILLTGITEGGDRLGFVDVDNGFGNTTRKNLRAGRQFLLGLGAGYRPEGSSFSAQATISWHSESVSAGQDRAAFDRFPIDVIGFYTIGRHRFGVGVTLSLLPELDMTDANGDVVEFDNATGTLMVYDFRWRNLAFGLRYVDIDYKVDTINGAKDADGDPIDGNHIGLMLTIPF